MNKYAELHSDIRKLRSNGLTYTEINNNLGTGIPKSSLSYICKGIVLSPAQRVRIVELMRPVLEKSRQKALLVNRKNLEDKIQGYKEANLGIRDFMQGPTAKLVALAILYLGEGSKWQKSRAPKLASADPLIVRLYIDLLRQCYAIPLNKLRARIQHRADQNSDELIKYWRGITGIEKFYPCYIDKRTIGKPTTKSNYKGVLTVGCAGTYIQLELAEIAGIIGDAVKGSSYNG